MARFQITGPDGKSYEITAPDGASEQDVMSFVQSNVGGGPPKAQPPPQPEPSWWQKNITGVRQQGDAQTPSVFSQFPDDLRRPTAAAATFGASDPQMSDIIKKQLGDRFVRSEKDPNGYDVFVTRGQNGEEQRGYVNQPGLDREDVSRAVYGALPYAVTGGVAGAATRGAGLLSQAIGQGVAGAGTSVAGDVVQMPLGSEQGIEGEKAGAIGLMGFGIPLAGRAAGNAMSAIKDRLAPQRGALQGASPKAVRNVEQGMSDARLTPSLYQHEAQRIGPEAMLGDMGTTLRDDAAMLAATPGAKDIATPRLQTRQALAPQRIESSLNTNLGPEINLPQYVKDQSKSFNGQAKPYYDQFYSAPVLSTPRLKEILSRAPRSAFSRAESLARADGIKQRFKINMVDDEMTPLTGVKRGQSERVIQGVEYDYLKRAIDDLAKDAKPGSNEQRIFSSMARDLRNEVDGILSPQNPSASPWAIARSISGEGLEGKDAAQFGAKMFSGKMDPHTLQMELADSSAHGRDVITAAGRNDLRQVMGRASSNFGPKGDTAARRALNNEFSRQNLEQVAGRRGAERITNRVDAENTMAELHDLALGNSKTDRMQAARKKWAPHTDSDFASQAGKKGPMGLATEAVFKVADALLGGQLRKAEARAALDGARILTAQGSSRDRIVDALFKHIEARNAGRISGQKFERTVKALLEGGRVPAMQDQR